MTAEAVQERLFRNQGVRTDLLRRSTTSVGLQLTHTALALLAGVMLARILGPSGYGTYAYVFSLVSLLAIPAQVGLPQLVVRETAKAQSSEEWDLMRGLWRWVTQVSVSLSMVLAFAAAGAAWHFAEHFDARQLATLTWGLLLVPVIALGNLRGAALRGLGRVVQGQLPEFVLRPGLLIVLLALPSWGATKMTPDQAMALHVVAATAAFAAGLWLLHLNRPWPRLAEMNPSFRTRQWITSALPLAFVASVHLITTQTDVLMLGVFEDTETVGIYRVAVQAAAVVTLGLTAVNMVVAPQFARLHAGADMARLQQVVTASSRIVMLLTLPVVIVFVVFGKSILGLLFGADYVTAYRPLAILTLGQLANATFGSVAFLLNMTGHEHITARAVGIAAIVNILLNLVLIPILGVIGAAVATGVTTFLLNFLLWHALRRRLGLESMALSFSHARFARTALLI